MLVRLPAETPFVRVGSLVVYPDRWGVIEVPDAVGAALIASGNGFEPATERPPPGPVRPAG